MKLKDYLMLRQITDEVAAKELNVTRQWLNKIKNGTPAGRKLAERIHLWTQGAVSKDELLYP